MQHRQFKSFLFICFVYQYLRQLFWKMWNQFSCENPTLANILTELLNFSLLICQKCIFVHLFLILWKNLWKTLCDIGIKMVENGAVKIPNRNLQSYKYRLTFIVKVTKHKNEKNLKELSIKNPTLFTLLWIVLLCNVNICRGCHL